MGIMDFMYKPKYRLIFLRREYNAMFVVKVKTLSDIKKLKKINDKQFMVDVNTPAYIHKNIYTFLLDWDTGSQLNYSEIKRQMGPEELDMIVGGKIIKELTAGVIDNNKEKLIWAVLGFGLGVLLGVVVMQFVMANKIEELNSTMTPVIPVIPTLGTMLKLRFF